MADFLSTGVSGLLAFRRALDVTSHNIANVGTEGYSRQRAELTTREAQPYGNGWMGSGVQVSTVRRMYDDALAAQAHGSTSNFERFEAFATQAQRVNNLFGSSTTGLTAALQKFTNALQDLSNNPTSAASRQTVLSEAQALVERLKTYDAQLAQYDAEIESRLASEANEITTLAGNIAQLNQEIARGFASTGQPPNDLLDQRDRLIDELSGHINVNVVGQSDGQVNVYIGNGQSLVLGNQAAQLSTSTSPYDPTRHGIAVRTANGYVDITQNLSGGTLGGVLDFREEVLDPARNSLGRISFGLYEAVNEQHRAGMDLTGAMGQNLFAVGSVESFEHSANAGGASLSVDRTDASALTETDYSLELTTSGWTLRRQDTGAVVPLTGTGTSADPLRADGLEIAVNGSASTGDRFLIRPTRAAAEGLDVLITDPSRIAAALPVRTTSAGTTSVASVEVTDPANAALRSSVTIEFLWPSTYSINGAGTYTLNSDNSIDYNGWRLELSGTPTAGDEITVADNSTGSGDNRNALKLAEALGTPILDGGTASLSATANRLVGDIGITTRQAQASRDAQQVVQQDSFAARDAVSGVNLDEEAANMLRYQQAYQAAAQIIRVASTLFDTLIAAAGR